MAAKQAAQKVLIVGGVAGGASCAARLRRLSEAVQITVFEKVGGAAPLFRALPQGQPAWLAAAAAQRGMSRDELCG